MKSLVVKSCLLVAFGALVVADASAQRGGARRRTSSGAPVTETPQQQTTNNAPANGNPYGNIPIVVDTSSANDGKGLPSLRNDNAFDKSFVNDRTPLPYEHLRADDALFAEKVWRELDLREKMNQTFRYEAIGDDGGNEMFINILLEAVNKGQVTAFEDERFSVVKSPQAIQEQTQGSLDTVPQVDPEDPSKVLRMVVTRSSFDPKTVLKLRIKEEWVFDRESSRMYCRILGIAPLKSQFFPNGDERPGSTPMFWVYYPELRSILARKEVYNPKNMGNGRMTWEELFESRMFSSYIVKSTFDNAANRAIRQYVKDPILALLEGENIKEKIFNFEQDLWSY